LEGQVRFDANPLRLVLRGCGQGGDRAGRIEPPQLAEGIRSQPPYLDICVVQYADQHRDRAFRRLAHLPQRPNGPVARVLVGVGEKTLQG